tara:strand:+ start:399 stop:647 length:249 start_codon:yes stop_codon:yes gene_type:complete
MMSLHLDNLAFLPNMNGMELILIFSVILLLFGAKKLPDLSRSLGKSIREFKKATSEIEEDIKTSMEPTAVKAESAPSEAKKD